jgi:hypothetical protein
MIGVAATFATATAIAEDIKVDITRVSVEDNIYTPYYQAQTVLDHQQGSAQKWLQLHVEYTTSGGWIDELHIEQLALVSDSNMDGPIILEEGVTYINVKPGDHYANVYMHPSLVERYGVDSFNVDSAVIFKIGDNVVAQAETTKQVEKGWSDDEDAMVHKGHLLNHAETPFWFINYDFKEIIKRDPHEHDSE